MLTLRNTKGSPLTNVEIDANFSGLADGSLLTGLSASTGSSLAGFIQSGTGAVARTVQAKERDVVSVKDFGAVGDGVTDDTAAIQAAHDSLGVNGGMLFFPIGSYLVSSVTVSKQCLLQGSGRFSGGTLILAKNASSNVFALTGSSITVRDMQFNKNINQSGGAYILCDAASSIINLENLYMLNWFVGVQINGVSDISLRNIRLSTGVVTTGVGISITSGITVLMQSIIVTNTLGQEPLTGIQITNCGDVTLIDCSLFHCVDGMRLIPGAGQVVTSVYAVNCFFDNNSTRGCLILTNSVTGTIQRCRFDGCWFASSGSSDGCLIDTNTTAGIINGITFIDPEMFLNGNAGLRISGANSSRIKVIGGKFAQNTGAGIAIITGADNIQIIGATCGSIGGLTGNATYGIANSAGVTDDLLIIGCQLTGNTTAGIQLGATGSRRFAYFNNGFVNENSGSGSIANGTTSGAFAHGLDTTPDATDFVFNMTAATTNDPGDIYVDTIGSANFTLHCRADPGATGLAFSWRARHIGI